MKILKKFLVGGLMGIGIGFLISIIISSIYGGGDFYVSSPEYLNKFNRKIDAVILATICYAILGIISIMTKEIYKLKYSLLVKTLLHFSVLMISLMSVGKILNWYDLNILSIVSFIGFAIIIYISTWTISYLKRKREIEKLNRKIKTFNKSK